MLKGAPPPVVELRLSRGPKKRDRQAQGAMASAALLRRLVAFGLSPAPTTWPAGTYEAHVRVPLVPAQQIRVVTPYQQRRGTGLLVLRGTVSLREEFRFNPRPGGWSVFFGETVLRALRRYRCQLVDFGYDSTTDVASVTIKMPLLGHMTLRLPKTVDPSREAHLSGTGTAAALSERERGARRR